MSWGRIGLALNVAVVVLAAVLGWLAVTGVLDERLVVLILLAVAAAIFAALLFRFARLGAGASGRRRSWLSTAGPDAPWSPIFATVTTFAALFLLGGRPDTTESGVRDAAVAVGLAAAAVVWVVGGWRVTFLSRPDTVNTRVFADILEKRREVRTRCTHIPEAKRSTVPAVAASEHMTWVDRELGFADEPATQSGLDWASGYAYVNVWMALHRAEEALLEISDEDELDAVVLHDRLRISGSRLTNLLNQVVRARRAVSSRASRLERRRMAVAAVRRAVNEFRDSRWDGLARARNRLNATSLITAWTGYLVLFVAVILEAPTDRIASAGVFFLVGALVGLFAQLRADAGTDEAVEDFGLSAARLRQTVIASGLAAVGGVLVTAMLADATGSPVIRNLGEVFPETPNPGQLFVAAIFGLSPQLLIERLTAAADRYRTDLKQTGTGDEDRRSETGGVADAVIEEPVREESPGGAASAPAPAPTGGQLAAEVRAEEGTT